MKDEQLVTQVRGAYLEMPGLRLTLRQARRLFGFDETTCRRLLEMLVEAGFLHRTDAGAYGRS